MNFWKSIQRHHSIQLWRRYEELSKKWIPIVIKENCKQKKNKSVDLAKVRKNMYFRRAYNIARKLVYRVLEFALLQIYFSFIHVNMVLYNVCIGWCQRSKTNDQIYDMF